MEGQKIVEFVKEWSAVVAAFASVIGICMQIYQWKKEQQEAKEPRLNVKGVWTEDIRQYVLRVENVGKVSVQNVNVQADELHYDTSQLPFNQLDAGNCFEISIILDIQTPKKFLVKLMWECNGKFGKKEAWCNR